MTRRAGRCLCGDDAQRAVMIWLAWLGGLHALMWRHCNKIAVVATTVNRKGGRCLNSKQYTKITLFSQICYIMPNPPSPRAPSAVGPSPLTLTPKALAGSKSSSPCAVLLLAFRSFCLACRTVPRPPRPRLPLRQRTWPAATPTAPSSKLRRSFGSRRGARACSRTGTADACLCVFM